MEEGERGRTGLGVEDHVEGVVVVGDHTPEAGEVEVVLDVVLVDLDEELVPLEATEPLDPRLILRRQFVRIGGGFHVHLLLATLVVHPTPFVSLHHKERENRCCCFLCQS